MDGEESLLDICEILLLDYVCLVAEHFKLDRTELRFRNMTPEAT